MNAIIAPVSVAPVAAIAKARPLVPVVWNATVVITARARPTWPGDPMEFVIGALLAFVLAGFPSLWGFGLGRDFYPAMLIVVASYYVLFAVTSGSLPTVFVECVLAGAFMAVAVTGFKSSLWVVVIALAGHGFMDVVHHLFIENTGVPTWWPGFCLAFDVVAAVVLALRLVSGHIPVGQTGQEAA